jgi:hypothetical protein
MATTKAPEPSITIKEIKAPGNVHAVAALEKAGDMTVEEFKPSDEDLARLAKSQATVATGQAKPTPEPTEPTAATIIAPSRAKQTMAEMERGAQIVKQKTELRAKMQAMIGR